MPVLDRILFRRGKRNANEMNKSDSAHKTTQSHQDRDIMTIANDVYEVTRTNDDSVIALSGSGSGLDQETLEKLDATLEKLRKTKQRLDRINKQLDIAKEAGTINRTLH